MEKETKRVIAPERFLPEARTAMRQLLHSGYQVYVVGGAVRDLLVGIDPVDYDLATDATPDAIMRVFSDYTVIPTGVAHGTVTVRIGAVSMEITTFRYDGTYTDKRHPDNVIFGHSLREDAARRDFTVNAMGLDQDGILFDYFDGYSDLSNRVIRAVGDPVARMREDALRILRALRFSSMRGFALEERTEAAIRGEARLLCGIAPERIWKELLGILCGAVPGDLLLRYTDVFGVIIPEILPMKDFEQCNPYHDRDVLAHTAAVVAAVPPDPNLRLAALFHDIGKPSVFTRDENGIGHFYGHQKVSYEIASAVMTRLRADKKTKETVETLVRWHDCPVEPDAKTIRRRLNRFGETTLRDLLALKRADTFGQAEPRNERMALLDKAETVLEEVLRTRDCFTLSQLAVNGEDLISFGLERGPQVGTALRKALSAVMDGEIPNQREEILRYLSQSNDAT